MIRVFKLFWLDGTTDIVEFQDLGNQRETLAAAMNSAGFSLGALQALDYWREITNE